MFGADVDTFDARNSAGVGEDVALHLVTEAADELVREVEDENAGALDGGFEIGCCDEIGG